MDSERDGGGRNEGKVLPAQLLEHEHCGRAGERIRLHAVGAGSERATGRQWLQSTTVVVSDNDDIALLHAQMTIWALHSGEVYRGHCEGLSWANGCSHNNAAGAGHERRGASEDGSRGNTRAPVRRATELEPCSNGCSLRWHNGCWICGRGTQRQLPKVASAFARG